MNKRAIIFDFNRTLFDPTTYSLYPGAAGMLQDVKEDRRLILFSRRGHDRQQLLRDLKIDECFEGAYFVEPKTVENLRKILQKHDLKPEECIVIGDLVADELCVGSEIGCETIWLKQDIFGTAEENLPCVPKYTANSIEELHALLKKIA